MVDLGALVLSVLRVGTAGTAQWGGCQGQMAQRAEAAG